MNIQIQNPINSSAIDLLENKEKWLEDMTNQIFSKVNYEGAISTLPIPQFQKDYTEQFEKNNFDDVYNNFYSYNNPIVNQFDVETETSIPKNLDELFADEHTNLTFELNSLKQDLNIL